MCCGVHGRIADGVRAGRAVGVTVGFPRTATDGPRWRHIPPRFAAEIACLPDGSCSRARRDGLACQLPGGGPGVTGRQHYSVERTRGVCNLCIGSNRLPASESRTGPTPRDDEDKGL